MKFHKLIAAMAVTAVAALGAGCQSDGPVEGDDGSDDAVAAGFPAQININRALNHARDFWGPRIPGTQSCAFNPEFHAYYSDERSANGRLATVGLATGCRTPGDNDGGVGQVWLNERYRWSYRRLCVVVAHEVGHLAGLTHNDNSAIMSLPTQIGEANCPT